MTAEWKEAEARRETGRTSAGARRGPRGFRSGLIEPARQLLRFDPSCEDGVAARFAALLLRDGLVDRELSDIRRSLHLDAGGGYAFLNPALKSVEVRSRLPEVDDSPTAINGTRRVVQHPLRNGSIWIDVVVCFIELFLGDSGSLMRMPIATAAPLLAWWNRETLCQQEPSCRASYGRAGATRCPH